MTQANIHSETDQVGPTGPSAQGEHDHDDNHVLPIGIYFAVWGALVVLTAITVFVSRFDFGSANTFIALLVATIKGSLVALYFMHLRYDNKLNLIVLLSSLLFVSIFFTPTLIDLSTRDALDPIKGHTYFRLNNAPVVPLPAAPAAVAPAAMPAPAPAAPPEHGAPPAPPIVPADPAHPAPAAVPTGHGAATPAPAHPAVAPAHH